MTETKPFYRLHVFCCVNRRPEGHPRGCCASRGGASLRDYMNARAKELGMEDVRINSAGCLDRCECGPTMVVYPDGVWYRAASAEDVDRVLTGHLIEGKVVADLRLPDDRT